MNTITISLDCQGKQPIFLGERGENEATEVVLDYSDWVDAFGDGTMQLYVMRSEDTYPYIVVLDTSDSVATWLVSSTDTSYTGMGKAEFVYTVDDVVAKTAVFYIAVGSAIDDDATEAPDPYETWLDTLTELSAATQENAEAAAESATEALTAQEAAEAAQEAAEEAQEAAETAQTAAETAEAYSETYSLKSEGYAVGTQDGEDVDSSSPYYQNNAAYYAEVAQQGAEASGYAWFDVDESDGQMYVTVTDTLSEDVTFSVNETNGTLEVIVS